MRLATLKFEHTKLTSSLWKTLNIIEKYFPWLWYSTAITTFKCIRELHKKWPSFQLELKQQIKNWHLNLGLFEAQLPFLGPFYSWWLMQGLLRQAEIWSFFWSLQKLYDPNSRRWQGKEILPLSAAGITHPNISVRPSRIKMMLRFTWWDYNTGIRENCTINWKGIWRRTGVLPRIAYDQYKETATIDKVKDTLYYMIL